MSAEGDEKIAKMRVALAEMGYGDARLSESGLRGDGSPRIWMRRGDAPVAVWWTACRLVGSAGSCWSCWLISRNAGDLSISEACLLGDCQHPEGPHKPPRELLVAR